MPAGLQLVRLLLSGGGAGGSQFNGYYGGGGSGLLECGTVNVSNLTSIPIIVGNGGDVLSAGLEYK